MSTRVFGDGSGNNYIEKLWGSTILSVNGELIGKQFTGRKVVLVAGHVAQ